MLTYARGYLPALHQSAWHMRRYKVPGDQSDRFRKDLQAMIFAATSIHGPCMIKVAGSAYTMRTFVPSAARPGLDHPAAELARFAVGTTQTPVLALLSPGPSIDSTSHGQLKADVFALTPGAAQTVLGQHVLLVEDTWVSGRNVLSASIALKDAGAAKVTILCVARWLDARNLVHKPLATSPVVPYDAMWCPVTRGACP